MAKSIRAAIIGLAEPAGTILDGLENTAGLKLVGLADAERERLEPFAEATGLSGYDDHRIMLIETRPEIVFINVPRYQEAELLGLAGELGIALCKPYPLGRDFDEAVDFVKLFGKADLGLYVSSPYRYCGGREGLARWLGKLGQVHLIEDEYFLPADLGCPVTGWRASKSQAGGGVLLEGAYPGLELITSQFGLPELVHCVTKTGLCGQSERPYETEDLSLMELSFGSGTVGCSVALRVAAERSRRTVWHGAKGQMSLGAGSVSFKPMSGEAMVHRFRDSLAKPYARQASDLVQILRGEQAGTSTGREHLLPMAVIEAAYLSARTGQPESPSHFFELHDLVPPAPPVITSPAE